MFRPFSLNWPSGLIQSLSRYVRQSSVCVDNPLLGGLETFGQRAYCYNWHTSRLFFNDFCVLKYFCFFGSLQNSLLCIMGELAEGGSVTVAVVVRDRGKVTRNT